MKNVLRSAGAVIVLAMGVSAASADDDRAYDNRYYGGNWHQTNWSKGGYRDDTVPPGVVVRYLRQQDYRHVSKPVRSGRFYQVEAITPRGHEVRLYIDAHSGRITDVKG